MEILGEIFHYSVEEHSTSTISMNKYQNWQFLIRGNITSSYFNTMHVILMFNDLPHLFAIHILTILIIITLNHLLLSTIYIILLLLLLLHFLQYLLLLLHLLVKLLHVIVILI